MPNSRPNLLVIQADQLKPQVLGAHGGPALTPHLESLWTRGVTFSNAYCNFPLCAPSRFSMLAGMLPSRIGAYDNGAEFPAQVPTMAHYLRMTGYHTCLSGKQHFVGPDMLHGFHERLVPELYPTDFSWAPSWSETRMDANSDSSGVTAAGICRRSVQMDHDEAVLYRARTKLHDYARDNDRPFFLVASFTHPHEPYYCLRKHWDRYRHEDIAMPRTPLAPPAQRSPHTARILKHHALANGDITDQHVRVARHAYLANVSYFDDMVGELLATLEDAGLAQSTIVIVTADHGDMLGEHGLWFKKHFSDHCAKVPLIIHAPDRFSPAVCEQPVSLVDLLPTLCELAGTDAAAQAPEALDGQSLVSLCEQSAEISARPVYGEITSEGVSEPMFMVRDGDHKLITGGGVPDSLYDLVVDPQERYDFIANPQERYDFIANPQERYDFIANPQERYDFIANPQERYDFIANPQERRDLAGDADTDTAKIYARLSALARAQWDATGLRDNILASQRRRRFVHAACADGESPSWDYQTSDPTLPWLHRGGELYNDWARRGIELDESSGGA